MSDLWAAACAGYCVGAITMGLIWFFDNLRVLRRRPAQKIYTKTSGGVRIDTVVDTERH